MKGVVELKARIRGHKRIFGCLKGDRLELREMKALSSSGAVYMSKLAHYCD